MSVCQSFMAACLFMCVSVSVVSTLMVCWCGDNSDVCVCVCVCVCRCNGKIEWGLEGSLCHGPGSPLRCSHPKPSPASDSRS